jgi:hypothetical protein
VDELLDVSNCTYIKLIDSEYLVLCCSAPVIQTRRISNAFLQTMSTKGAQGYTCRSVDTPDSPERHDANIIDSRNA